jgi:hypothetical protein
MASEGEYVALLDADDLWLPDKLSLQVASLETSSAAACVCGYEMFNDRTRQITGVVAFRPGSRPVESWLTLEGNGLLLPSTAVVRRAALDEMRGFDPELSVSADLDFAIRLESVGPVLALPETLVRYRLHDAQMHRRLSDLSHDMSLLYDRVFCGGNDGPLERRCRANLEAYLGYSHMARGRPLVALPLLLASLRRDPRRIVSLPLRAMARRLVRRIRALDPGRDRRSWS